jgi:hypothetical protein
MAPFENYFLIVVSVVVVAVFFDFFFFFFVATTASVFVSVFAAGAVAGTAVDASGAVLYLSVAFSIDEHDVKSRVVAIVIKRIFILGFS